MTKMQHIHKLIPALYWFKKYFYWNTFHNRPHS